MSKYKGIVKNIIAIDLTLDDDEDFVRLAGKAKSLLANELAQSSGQYYTLLWIKF